MLWAYAKSASGVMGANCGHILHEYHRRCQFTEPSCSAKSPVSRVSRLPGYYFHMDTEEPTKIPLLIRRIMPDASEAQLLDATAIFEDYMAIVWRILKRLERDQSGVDRNAFRPP